MVKNVFTACLGMAVLISCTQCKKMDSDGLMLESHDANIFMKIMHQSMDSMMNMTGMSHDPDHDFARMMKMHHMGAVEMADKVIAIGNDVTIKAIATKMKVAQMREIAQLDSFTNAHTAMMDMNTGLKFMEESDMAMKKMMAANDLRPLTGKADFDFSQLMVDHHQSAIEMAESIMKYGDVPFITNMAMMMKKDQQMEIKEMQDWMLKNRPYGSGGH